LARFPALATTLSQLGDGGHSELFASNLLLAS